MIRAKVLLALGLMTGYYTGLSQTRQPAFAMNERLGRGINMGNSFEAPTETAWGNPWSPAYFKMISALGFRHVRVPIRWETSERSMSSSPYTINADFLNRIKQVVDTALRYQLHIIINMHHHDALYENPAGEKSRFLSQWYQIADHFKNYSDSLLFEVLNEPHGNLTASLWNEYFAEALIEIRKTNPTRVVLMGVADYGGLRSISNLQLPQDGHIILSVHYYNPFPFTHQGAEWVSGANQWLGTRWLDTEAERLSAVSEFNYAMHFSETNHIPIHVGEFGAYSKADIESRERWTTFLARWFEQNNMSWAYWEFSAGFGIYDPAAKQYVPQLVNALLMNEIPEATPVFPRPVYVSNFSAGTDGWLMHQQGGATGNLNASGNKLNVSISNGGTEQWHLQLVKNNIPLEKGRLYLLSFSGQAQYDRSITFYAGKATSPWNAYSSYNAVNISPDIATYTFTFTMTSDTDRAARLVFDLGTSTAGVNITSVKVEELAFSITSTETELVQQKTRAYPNPTSSRLWIPGSQKYHTAELFDLGGRCHGSFQISTPCEELDLASVPAGIYVLLLTGTQERARIKIMKK